jgi:hypothetical protein
MSVLVFVTERKRGCSCRPRTLTSTDMPGSVTSRQQPCSLPRPARATLHHLRNSALTHDAEDGTGTLMPMARSGHTSVRSLAKYARVPAQALQRHQAERDGERNRLGEAEAVGGRARAIYLVSGGGHPARWPG